MESLKIEYKPDLTYRKQTFDERLKAEYDLWRAIFGAEETTKRMKEMKPLTVAMRKLWKQHGFTEYGQYEDWERTHLQERNNFLISEGVMDLWLM